MPALEPGLTEGSSGPAVRSLQRHLSWLGFPIDRQERQSERFGNGTSVAVASFQRAHELSDTGEVDGSTRAALVRAIAALTALDQFTVRGTARRRNGAPWPGVTVEVYDVDLRSAQLLGRTRTDEHGAYLVTYASARYRRFELESADLVARVVHDDAGSSTRAAILDPSNALALTGPIFNAPAHATLDLFEDNAIHAGQSVWDRMAALLSSRLLELKPAALTDDDVEFLSEEASLTRDRVALFALAYRHAEAAAHHGHSVPPAACFALLVHRRLDDLGSFVRWASREARPLLAGAMPHIIPLEAPGWIDRVVAALAALNVALIKALPGAQSPLYLARLAVGDKAVADYFVDRLLAHSRDLSSLWRDLSRDERLAPHIPSLQRVVQLAELTDHHAPLYTALEQQFVRNQAIQLEDFLPQISDAEFHALVVAVGAPDGVNIDAYVEERRAAIELTYPTQFVAARVDRLGIERPAEVAAFLRRERAFDLHGPPLDQLLADRPELVERTPPEVLSEIERVQRLHRAIGRVDDLEVLLASDRTSSSSRIGSAADIVRLGRDEVRRRFGREPARADAVFDRASAARDSSINLWARLRPEIDSPLGRHVRPPFERTDADDMPILASIAVDFCSCEKCRSVLSPAAYLTDLLAMIDQVVVGTDRDAKDYLYYRDPKDEGPRLLRRADLGTILLDCPNTTTPLPYIDLVNELLEWHVAGKNQPFHYQTTRTPEELLVAPENVLDEVYDDILPKAVYPWTLPFSLAHETARVFLGNFGLDRHRLMNLLAGALPTKEIEREAESLQITLDELKLLRDINAPPDPWTVWNLVESSNEIEDPLSDPDKPTILTKQTWLQVLSFGKYLRQQSGLSQEETLAALMSRFVAYTGDLATKWPVTECNFDRAVDLGLTAKQAQRFHQLVRLAAKLKWTLEATDVALSAIGAPGIDDDTLIVVARLARLAARTGRPFVEMLTWVSTIPTWPTTKDGPSLYEQTFLSPIANPDQQAPFLLNADRTALAKEPAPFPGELRPVAAAAAGLTLADFEALLANEWIEDKLSLPTLARLHRIATMARASGWSIVEWIRLLPLIAKPPILQVSDTTTPPPERETAERCHALLELVETFAAVGLENADILYLTSGEQFGRTIAPEDQLIQARLRPLYAELRKLALGLEWPSVTRQRRTIQKHIASLFGVDDAVASALLRRTIAGQERFVTFELTDAAQLDETTYPAKFAGWVEVYRQLHKIALLLGRRGLIGDDAVIAIERGKELGWFDFDSVTALPDQAGAVDRFMALGKLAGVVRLRDSIRGANRSLFAALAKPDAERVAALEVWRGVDPDSLADIVAELKLAPDSLTDPENLARLFGAFDALHKLGVPVEEAVSFAHPVLPLATAHRLRDAARASHPRQDWVSIAKPLQDRLRTRQRDALVARLGATRGLSARELFDELLIDVEMSDCMLTSRIQQAICSVQLFTQRMTMHLERTHGGEAISLGEDPLAQWKTYLSTYRAWAEARAVFLYPESTLDPALRRDKSEPFVALEKKLSQADVTTELARDALLEYLEELDTVALLEPRALYHEDREAADGGTIHVLSRTRGIPHRYYYRQQRHGIWSAWERVPLDITDEHTVLVVVDGRLFLYWPQFVEKAKTSRPGKDKSSSPEPYFEITLAWSERKQDKWLPKRTTRESLRTAPFAKGGMVTSTIIRPNFPWENSTPGTTSSPATTTAPATASKPQFPLPAHVTPAEFSLHPIFGKEMKALLSADEYVGDDGDLWMVLRRPKRDDEEGDHDSFIGWFVFSGCNGAVRTGPLDKKNEPTISSMPFAAALGPVGGGILWNNDWRQRGDFDLVSAPNEEQVVLDTTTETSTVHAMEAARDQRFYQGPKLVSDGRRAYFVEDAGLALDGSPSAGPYWIPSSSPQFEFSAFYHSYTCTLIQRLNEAASPAEGIRQVLATSSQLLAEPVNQSFNGYSPTDAVAKPLPQQRIEFALNEAYGPYNWELFFYVPLLVADRLRANQRFDEAINWLQLIFDPTAAEAANNPENAWQFLPLRGRSETSIQELFALLHSDTSIGGISIKKLMEAHIREWRRNPFDPHAVARHRLGAWMRAVTIRYADTLIAWGDNLLRRETIEAVNQATLMYLLALDTLGEQPRDHASRAAIAPKTYEQLASMPLDAFSNALVKVENWVPPTVNPPKGKAPIPIGMSFYYCIPRNDRIDRYWSVIADRLFKVRHCLDIEGRYRQLALFDGLLGQIGTANALGDALDGTGEIPPYRFSVLMQKAVEFAGDVQRLGGSLLAALEKRDAETLSLLRSSHERALLSAVRDIKLLQGKEASTSLAALQKGLEAAQHRFDYYSSRPNLNAQEITHLALTGAAIPLQIAAGALESASGLMNLFPDVTIGISGFAGSPVSTFRTGGPAAAASLSSAAAAVRTRAGELLSRASLAQTMGSYARRRDDWDYQRGQAQIEIAQIEQQITAAELRVQIAERDLANHDLQIAQADEVADFLTSKFTSEQLYGWLVEQLGTLYFKAYELAYDLGKRAERAFQFERGDFKQTYLEPAYFDKLREGLLAGERLQLDLRRMEAAYLDQNRREFELTKHVSMAQLFPEQLMELVTRGWCEVELPEELFDRDHPGHYFRRIKTLALSLPCVGGGFATVNATVTVQKSRIRISPDPTAPYAEASAAAALDSRFAYSLSPVDSFAVSTGQTDTGLFETNLRDDRYLPCEGAGGLCRLRIELSMHQTDIDPRRVSDAILHLRYTARDGGDLKKTVVETFKSGMQTAKLYLSARHDLPDAWQTLLSAAPLAVDLSPARFPYWAIRNGSVPSITTLDVFVVAKTAWPDPTTLSAGLLTPSGGEDLAFKLRIETEGLVLAAQSTLPDVPGTWQLSFDGGAEPFDPTQLEDILIVASFESK